MEVEDVVVKYDAVLERRVRCRTCNAQTYMYAQNKTKPPYMFYGCFNAGLNWAYEKTKASAIGTTSKASPAPRSPNGISQNIKRKGNLKVKAVFHSRNAEG